MNKDEYFQPIVLVFLMFGFACASKSILNGNVPSVKSENFSSYDQVSLNESEIVWTSYQYNLNSQNEVEEKSFDKKTLVKKNFKVWILENQFLKITLLPDLGGRVFSVIYKPTGHEQLYQNPVGVPYDIGKNFFYYNWLMIVGGIFPTFTEPEHGKSWILPWQFEVISKEDNSITVRMSLKDDIHYARAPYQFGVGQTDLKFSYYITLSSGSTRFETKMKIENSSQLARSFEYWTCATLAPGSIPGESKTTAAAKIIAPIENIKVTSNWSQLAEQEEKTNLSDVYKFEKLRYFKNWPDMGIAYAYPDMVGKDFWGVINQENDEGFFRISDNSLTRGLKIWTWGYTASKENNPWKSTNPARPNIELWAGLSNEFWKRITLEKDSQIEILESYTPSVGLHDVTHATKSFLVNLSFTPTGFIECQFFATEPHGLVEASLFLDDKLINRSLIPLRADQESNCSSKTLGTTTAKEMKLRIKNLQGEVVFEGITMLNTQQVEN